MKFVELTLVTGERIMLGLSGNFAVCSNDTKPMTSILSDGVHNNGGWKVNMPYTALVKLLKKELS